MSRAITERVARGITKMMAMRMVFDKTIEVGLFSSVTMDTGMTRGLLMVLNDLKEALMAIGRKY